MNNLIQIQVRLLILKHKLHGRSEKAVRLMWAAFDSEQQGLDSCIE